jgi:hypothetical protein
MMRVDLPSESGGVQSEGGARVYYKVVLSTVQGVITLLTELTRGDRALSDMWWRVNLHSEESAFRGRCTSVL